MSYLTNRSQFIQIGNNFSTTVIIARGSPQGSVLSPVLFIIFISDIDDWTDFSTLSGFADDYSATVVDSTFQGMLEKLEHDAKKILSFMASNRLFVNESKTTFIIFSRKERDLPIAIKVGNSNIVEVTKLKLLGVIFTPDLKWKEHINTLTEKLRHHIFLLRHLSRLIPHTALKIVAEGLVTNNQPHPVLSASFLPDSALRHRSKTFRTRKNPSTTQPHDQDNLFTQHQGQSKYEIHQKHQQHSIHQSNGLQIDCYGIEKIHVQ